MNTKALIIVDYQIDFISGSLAVPGAEQLRDGIYHEITHGNYGPLILTRDWHPVDHISFASRPRFEDYSWPSHCVQGTPGAVVDLPVKINSCLLISKGTDVNREAYSGFEGDVDLVSFLEQNHFDAVDICGLALDYCVKNTALDAARFGFKTRVLGHLTAPVKEETGAQAIEELEAHSVEVVL